MFASMSDLNFVAAANQSTINNKNGSGKKEDVIKADQTGEDQPTGHPVSYTHLTLPTIYSV